MDTVSEVLRLVLGLFIAIQLVFLIFAKGQERISNALVILIMLEVYQL